MTERDAARAILLDLARRLGHDVTAAQAKDWESSGYSLQGEALLVSDLVRAWTLIISQVERVPSEEPAERSADALERIADVLEKWRAYEPGGEE